MEAEDRPARALGSSDRAISDSVVAIKRPGCLSDGQIPLFPCRCGWAARRG